MIKNVMVCLKYFHVWSCIEPILFFGIWTEAFTLFFLSPFCFPFLLLCFFWRWFSHFLVVCVTVRFSKKRNPAFGYISLSLPALHSLLPYGEQQAPVPLPRSPMACSCEMSQPCLSWCLTRVSESVAFRDVNDCDVNDCGELRREWHQHASLTKWSNWRTHLCSMWIMPIPLIRHAFTIIIFIFY